MLKPGRGHVCCIPLNVGLHRKSDMFSSEILWGWDRGGYNTQMTNSLFQPPISKFGPSSPISDHTKSPPLDFLELKRVFHCLFLVKIIRHLKGAIFLSEIVSSLEDAHH